MPLNESSPNCHRSKPSAGRYYRANLKKNKCIICATRVLALSSKSQTQYGTRKCENPLFSFNNLTELFVPMCSHLLHGPDAQDKEALGHDGSCSLAEEQAPFVDVDNLACGPVLLDAVAVVVELREGL